MQEDIEPFGDVGSLEDNVESFLSNDDGDVRDLFGTLKRNSAEQAAETSKGSQWSHGLSNEDCSNWLQLTLCLSKLGFSFNEVGSIRKSNSKVVCCHFSSDGKLLASAGHDKKVWYILPGKA